ncbi:MAG: HEAT repeat domain-containing protein [Candidatus Nitrosopelagicus sp.]|nr:HEAT repeat domain-containing protein [Candidatus Nitrosopelagicus sp.]
MPYTAKEITDILNNDNKDKKISLLSNLTEATNSKIIMQIISALDDNEIRVRGEAFSSLFLNDSDISEILISSLTDNSKNIRGFSALILANRGDTNSIDALIDLTKDTSGMVRACAFGALGHLRMKQAKKEIHAGIFDDNIEVKKSAAFALYLIEEKLSELERKELENQSDDDFNKILKWWTGRDLNP